MAPMFNRPIPRFPFNDMNRAQDFPLYLAIRCRGIDNLVADLPQWRTAAFMGETSPQVPGQRPGRFICP